MGLTHPPLILKRVPYGSTASDVRSGHPGRYHLSLVALVATPAVSIFLDGLRVVPSPLKRQSTDNAYLERMSGQFQFPHNRLSFFLGFLPPWVDFDCA